MKNLKNYLRLMQEHPEWFRNTGEPGEIRIILQEQRILSEQKRIRARLQKEGRPTSWIDIGVLAEDEWFYVIRDLVEFPDGRVGGYIRWINRKSAEEGGHNVILMCTNNQSVLLIRKFRHESRSWSWEFPRGFGEPGFTAEENALKELQEELGISEVIKLTYLARIPQGKGSTVAFLAEIPKQHEITLDKHEGLQTFRWLTKCEFEESIQKGLIQDFFSLWAFTVARVLGLF